MAAPLPLRSSRYDVVRDGGKGTPFHVNEIHLARLTAPAIHLRSKAELQRTITTAERTKDWRMPRNILFTFILGALLSACAGVGVVATDNPHAKMSQARQLADAGRAAQARRQLDEAIAIFTQKNDAPGLAEAYRQYGFLARLGMAAPDVILMRMPGPDAPTVADLDLSTQYFQKSAEILSQQALPDQLSNVYFNLGVNDGLYAKYHPAPGKRESACAHFDRSLQANRDAEERQPGLKVDLPRGMRSFAELIARAKSEAGCA
jgi:tetratricopeptide (TPR) repeat protein